MVNHSDDHVNDEDIQRLLLKYENRLRYLINLNYVNYY